MHSEVVRRLQPRGVLGDPQEVVRGQRQGDILQLGVAPEDCYLFNADGIAYRRVGANAR